MSGRYLYNLFRSSDVTPADTFVDEIDDDWELIEILDKELSNRDEDAESDIQCMVMDFPSDAPYLKIKYRILSKADVRARLENKASKVSTVLMLSRSEAIILLDHFDWSVQRTQEEWLNCEEKVRNAVGLFDRPVEEADSAEIPCGFCKENFPGDLLLGVSCGHLFCRSCWTEYISEAINETLGRIPLQCLDCNAAVGLDMIKMLSSEYDYWKYEDYLLKSFVERSRKAKWCPTPGCEHAVFLSAGAENSSNIACRCSHTFCWNCFAEPHAPVGCAMAADWLTERVLQSDNWMLANTRPCPNCDRPIEKDSCNIYSQCSICSYGFRSAYDETQQFQPAPSVDSSYRISGPSDENNDLVRDIARNSLARYTSYNEGWATGEMSGKNAEIELTVLQDLQLERFCEIWGLCSNGLDFLVDAQLQVVECWGLLKWAYVYGYYMSEDEGTRKPLFEFMQEQAADLVDRLEKLVQNLQDVLKEDISLAQFNKFRGRVIQLTRVTRNYFERFVEVMKSDFSDVISIPRLGTCTRLNPMLKMSKQEGSSSSLCPSSSTSTSSSPSSRLIRGDSDDIDSPAVRVKIE